MIALRISFCRNDADAPGRRLHLPLQGLGSGRACCRVRIYLPDDARDAPVVICSELPNNPGGSITNSAELIAAGVIQANELPTPLVWIEHWPEESTEGQVTFELDVFSSYRVEERAPYLGETRAWIRDATWKRLDRATVEVLVGGRCRASYIADSPRFLSAATPSLGAAERTRWGRGIRRFAHWSIIRGQVGPTSMCVETVLGLVLPH
jgi:hypothetical protein